jgi:putative (di)nucleoside polyphosphate hydrolase
MSHDHLPYRPAAGIMLVNADGKVFVGQRIDNKLEAWQMPQGGLDPDEEPEAAALRELEEETGIKPEHVEIVAVAPEELLYDLPADMIPPAPTRTSISTPRIPSSAPGNGPSRANCPT